MKVTQRIRSKKTLFIVVLVLSAAVVFISFASTPKENTGPVTTLATDGNAQNQVPTPAPPEASAASDRPELTDHISKAVLRVDNMSCSGCVYTIKSSLEPFEGIRDVLVDVSGGLVEVYYDNQQVKAVDAWASAITASGYPAKLVEVLTAAQLREQQAYSAARAETYIASAGKWDISRKDFDTEYTHARNRYAQMYGEKILSSERGKLLADNLKTQIASRLILEGIQMQEIQRAGFKVDSTAVDNAYRRFLEKKNMKAEQFAASLEKNGYPLDYFKKKFEQRVLIDRYLNEEVLSGVSDEFERQRRYTAWLNNAKLLAKVVYYDKDLEGLVQSQAAGGGCSGGNSCSRAKK